MLRPYWHARCIRSSEGANELFRDPVSYDSRDSAVGGAGIDRGRGHPLYMSDVQPVISAGKSL